MGYLKEWPSAPHTVEAIHEGTVVRTALLEERGNATIYRMALPADMTSGAVTFRVNGDWARQYVFLAPGATIALNLTPGKEPPEPELVHVRGTINQTLAENTTAVQVVVDGAPVAESTPTPAGEYAADVPAWVVDAQIRLVSSGASVFTQNVTIPPAEEVRIDLAPTSLPPTQGDPATTVEPREADVPSIGFLGAIGALVAALAWRPRS